MDKYNSQISKASIPDKSVTNPIIITEVNTSVTSYFYN